MIPKLSIIVPVFNKAKFLNSCLKSILNQTFTDFELILINDGSSDESAQICAEFMVTDSRIIVLNQENQGVSAARNNGLKLVKGNYVGFIDADDTIASDMFELLIKNVLEKNADISICNIQITDDENALSENAETVSIKTLDMEQTLTALLNGTINWSANNKIYKKELATQIHFEGRMNEDLLYCFNIITQMKGRSVYQAIAKYNYIKRDNSVSLSKFDDRQLESVRVSKKILNAVKEGYPQNLHDAKVLDFISNLSLLNLAILSKQTKANGYKEVERNLKKYSEFKSTNTGISMKQKYAYNAFMFNPQLYSYFLNVYCKIFSSEAGKKVL